MVQSQDSGPLTIGKLAAAGGVGVETVRFYQRKGLLGTPQRAGSVRRYGSEDVRQLRFIRSAQAAGFTLEEIRKLLTLDASNDRGRVHDMAVQRVKSLEEQISRLIHAREALLRLARQCGGEGAGPCPILTSFEEQPLL
jgi:MerR family transcriptional regulator, mercuric resistance operon regulatory protein